MYIRCMSAPLYDIRSRIVSYAAPLRAMKHKAPTFAHTIHGVAHFSVVSQRISYTKIQIQLIHVDSYYEKTHND